MSQIKEGNNIGIGDQSSENKAEGLFKIVDGQNVLRQLKPPEITDYRSLPIITTPEGFKIRGQNSTDLILGLTELTLLDSQGNLHSSPTSISYIEHSLRPMRDDDEFSKKQLENEEYLRDDPRRVDLWKFPHGCTRNGIIGPDESLLNLIANTRQETAELGIDASMLASFLTYFRTAYNYAKKIGAYKKPDYYPKDPHYFECNGKIFLYDFVTRTRSRGGAVARSPFRDGNLPLYDIEFLSLAWDGKGSLLKVSDQGQNQISGIDDAGKPQIIWNSRMATWLDRYGFAGSRDRGAENRGFRIDVKKTAELAGFVTPGNKLHNL